MELSDCVCVCERFVIIKLTFQVAEQLSVCVYMCVCERFVIMKFTFQVSEQLSVCVYMCVWEICSYEIYISGSWTAQC